MLALELLLGDDEEPKVEPLAEVPVELEDDDGLDDVEETDGVEEVVWSLELTLLLG